MNKLTKSRPQNMGTGLFLGGRAGYGISVARASQWDVEMVFSGIPSSRKLFVGDSQMTKPRRKLKKANHGKRPANAKARKSKRKAIKT